MAWCDVDGAGASFGGDKVGEDDLGRPCKEGVLSGELIEGFSLTLLECGGECKSGFFREICDEFADDDEGFFDVVFLEFANDVGELWVKCDAEVRGKSPWGCGPDHHRSGAREITSDKRKFHKHSGAFFVSVFDFRLGKSRLRTV